MLFNSVNRGWGCDVVLKTTPNGRGWDFSSKMSSLKDFEVYGVDFIATIILSLRDLKVEI